MLRFKKYAPLLEVTKENVMRYVLHIWVNMESDPEKIKDFMEKYKSHDLNKDLPFQEEREDFVICLSNRKQFPLLNDEYYFGKESFLKMTKAWVA